ncbi:ATPase [Sphingobacterium psychroaquaticum]|nr:ATPase [Sphingobacterium psychroaquaticum]
MKPRRDHSTSPPQHTKTMTNHYDYPKIFQYIKTQGQATYGKSFALTEHDMPIIRQLAAYFLQDEKTCIQENIDPKKGIMLTGPIGCGKTALFNIMRFLTTPNNRYIIKSVRDITFEFIKEGYDIIHRYSRGHLYQSQNRKIYCFDDLGTENNIKYYGNECNVMAEILLSRYDLYITHNLQTHITTNLSATELEQAYGNRLRSRLRQMVNLIGFDKEVTDKRR